jgi:hypothetical protein
MKMEIICMRKDLFRVKMRRSGLGGLSRLSLALLAVETDLA